MSDSKYKQFRNYMVNELGITKQDIQAWTKEAAVNEVQKTLDRIDIEALARKTTESRVNNIIKGQSFSEGRELREAIAKELVKTLNVKIEQIT